MIDALANAVLLGVHTESSPDSLVNSFRGTAIVFLLWFVEMLKEFLHH